MIEPGQRVAVIEVMTTGLDFYLSAGRHISMPGNESRKHPICLSGCRFSLPPCTARIPRDWVLPDAGVPAPIAAELRNRYMPDSSGGSAHGNRVLYSGRHRLGHGPPHQDTSYRATKTRAIEQKRWLAELIPNWTSHCKAAPHPPQPSSRPVRANLTHLSLARSRRALRAYTAPGRRRTVSVVGRTARRA
jgi:hypothetical protein